MHRFTFTFIFTAFISPLFAQQFDTLLIDFGSVLSPAPWNNLTTANTGQITDLVTSTGLTSTIDIAITDAFNGVNTAGTQSPDPSSGFPATATGDSFFGNTVVFGGITEPTGAVTLSGLPVAQACTVILFASRTATDNRETRYMVSGQTQTELLLNASSNTSITVSATLMPAADGSVSVTASPGAANNNTNGFFYLGAMKVIVPHQTPVNPPSVDLLAPNGGEWWQTGKTPFIYWESQNIDQVILEYSTNNGANWAVIDTVPALLKKWPWPVPAAPSETCLVRIKADSLQDQSEAVFTISDQHLECPIVILGSSTAEGAGASTADSAWVNRFRHAIFQRNTRYSVVNLAKGGYTTYHILPTGTPATPGVNIAIDQARNVSKALTYNPYAIIINMPSNDAANNFGVEAQLNNFALVHATATAMGVKTWVCTTQPRNFTNPAQIQIQRDVKDSILSIYGDYAINFWDVLADANGFILSGFNAGDGIHLNNAGHRAIWEVAMEQGIDTADCTLSGSKTPTSGRQDTYFRAYPNPYDDDLVFEFDAPAAGDLRVLFINTAGAVIDTFETRIVDQGPQKIRYHQDQKSISQGPLTIWYELNTARGIRSGALQMVKM